MASQPNQIGLLSLTEALQPSQNGLAAKSHGFVLDVAALQPSETALQPGQIVFWFPRQSPCSQISNGLAAKSNSFVSDGMALQPSEKALRPHHIVWHSKRMALQPSQMALQPNHIVLFQMEWHCSQIKLFWYPKQRPCSILQPSQKCKNRAKQCLSLFFGSGSTSFRDGLL